ncbi:hypothetical protein M9435_003936 [Picochlorum sp. BPE23]|nr:hypothetical protein M9435_003936 [Picochlorum sp. BPE23]
MLMKHVLDSEEWCRVKEELDQVCPLVSHLWPRDGDVNQADMQALQEVCYQKIHTGTWCDVLPVWRDAYGGACLLLGLLYESQGQSKEESIRMFDMGLLLGGDRFRSMTHDMIAILKDSSARTAVHDDDDDDVWVEQTGEVAMVDPPSASPATQGMMEKVEYNDLALDKFIIDYMSREKPVVISHMGVDWPAYTRWNSRAYWRSIAMYRTVPVEVGKDYMAPEWTQTLMSFSKFLNHMTDRDRDDLVYLAQHQLLEQIPELKQDIIIPDYCHATGDVVSINAWIGPAGTVTPIHSDPHHNVFCQIVGYKYLRLYAPEYASDLQLDTDGLTHNTSTIDIEKDDNPLTHVPCVECTLAPGDALFIPRGFFHYVKSLTPSASVSIWWDDA